MLPQSDCSNEESEFVHRGYEMALDSVSDGVRQIQPRLTSHACTDSIVRCGRYEPPTKSELKRRRTRYS